MSTPKEGLGPVTSPFKRRVKRFVIATEMWWYGVTAAGFVVAVGGLFVGAPTISTLQLAMIQLFTGFTATVAAGASAVKSNDTET